jgi:hypothetical protein
VLVGHNGRPSGGVSSTMGQPPKSLSLLLEDLELFERCSLTGRPALLIKGAINELCLPRVFSTIGLLELS